MLLYVYQTKLSYHCSRRCPKCDNPSFLKVNLAFGKKYHQLSSQIFTKYSKPTVVHLAHFRKLSQLIRFCMTAILIPEKNKVPYRWKIPLLEKKWHKDLSFIIFLDKHGVLKILHRKSTKEEEFMGRHAY